MIQIAICDDEEIFVKQIHDEVERILTEKNVEFEISDYTDGRKLLEENEFKKFDLVLLDIDMPEMDGFELTNKLQLTPTMFITNYDEFVYKSYRFGIISYILKSKLKVELEDALDFYISKYKKKIDVFHFKCDGIDQYLKYRNIIYFESFDHEISVTDKYSNTYNIQRERNKPVSLKSIEKQCETYGFIRVNKSFIVNYIYIKKFYPDKIVTDNLKEIYINRKNMKMIQEKFHKLILEDEYD